MIRSIRAAAIALSAIALAACSHTESRSASSSQPGADVQVVSGKVYRRSHQSVTIQPTQGGPERTLRIDPQTAIAINGQRSTTAEIFEGQEVRAAYDQVDGRDVAVSIEAMPGAGGGTTPNTAWYGGGVGGASGGSTTVRWPNIDVPRRSRN